MSYFTRLWFHDNKNMNFFFKLFIPLISNRIRNKSNMKIEIHSFDMKMKMQKKIRLSENENVRLHFFMI